MGGMRSLPILLRPALALLLVVPLAACGGPDPVASGERPVRVEPDNPSVASGVADPSAPRIVSIVIEDGRTTGDIGVVELKRNVPVLLTVITDQTGTVLVEGYGLRTLATAGSPIQVEFIVDRPGEFAVVLEESDTELTTLSVS